MTRRFILVAYTALMAACVISPVLPDLTSKPTVYTGRFALSYQKEGISQREQGGFEWKIQATTQADKAMQLSLLSPLGSTVAVIGFDPKAPADKRASLTSPSQTDYATDLDSLMQHTLGWRLPLTELLPWLGKAAPNDAPVDWTIVVASRYDTGLPKLITTNHSVQNIQVRLVFEQ
jgi:outer membrane lipoprotein LolB